MNKSELELQNIQSIIDEMPAAERALCVSMVSSLMASVGHPVHGRVFMIAVAFTNCQVAVHNIKMGLVNEDGSIPEKFMQGDGRKFGGHKAEVVAVDECPVEQGIEAMASERLKTLDKGKLISMEEMQDRYSGFHSGGYVGDSKLKEGEVEGVVAKPTVKVEIINQVAGKDTTDKPISIRNNLTYKTKPGSFEA